MSSRKSLGVVFLVLFMDMVAFGMLLPLVGIYGRHFQATPLQLTMLGGAFSIMQFVFAPIWGSLSDRWGRRPVLLSTISGGIIAFLLFGMARSYWVLLFSRALSGVFAANISVAQAYVSDVTEEKDRAKSMGMVGAAIGLGFVFGPPIGGISAHRLSLGAPGLLAAVFGVVNLLYAYRYLIEPEGRDKAERHRSGFPLSAETFGFLRSLPAFALLVITGFVATFAFCHMEQAFSLFLQNRFSLATSEAGESTGLLLMWIGLCGAVVQGLLIRRLVARFGEWKLLLASFLIQAAGMFLFPFGQGWFYYYAVSVLFAVGSGLGNPNLFSLLSKSVDKDQQGYAMGLAHGFSSLARALGPMFALTAFSVAISLPFLIAGTLYVFLFLWLLRNRNEAPAEV